MLHRVVSSSQSAPSGERAGGSHSAASAASGVAWTGWALLAFSILLETAGQLCFKLSASQVGSGLANLEVVKEAALSNWAVLGYICMGLQFPVWMGVLARLDLSLAFPLGSLSQITILLASVFVLSESIEPFRLLGIASIMLGTVLIVGESEAQP